MKKGIFEGDRHDDPHRAKLSSRPGIYPGKGGAFYQIGEILQVMNNMDSLLYLPIIEHRQMRLSALMKNIDRICLTAVF